MNRFSAFYLALWFLSLGSGRAWADPLQADRDTSSDERPVQLNFLNMPDWSVGLHIGGGALNIDEAALARAGIGTPAGFAIGVRATFLTFVAVDVGGGWLGAPDHAPFTETACPASGGDCITDDSSVSGGMGWAKIGPQLKLYVPLADDDALELVLAGFIGVRGWSLERSVKYPEAMCMDCEVRGINVDGGGLLGPELSVAYALADGSAPLSGAFGGRFAYEYFLAGHAISAFWLSGFVDFELW